jgi:hypothetical protein
MTTAARDDGSFAGCFDPILFDSGLRRPFVNYLAML